MDWLWYLVTLYLTGFGYRGTSGYMYPLCFLDNLLNSDPQVSQLLLLCVDKVDDCNVTLTKVILGTTETFLLDHGVSSTINLDPDLSRLDWTVIENKGITVYSDGELAILGYDCSGARSCDVFIPRELGYLGQMYVAFTHCQQSKKCLIGIVAAKVSVLTTVTIILPKNFTATLTYQGQDYTGGKVLCVYLSYLQTFQVVSTSDLTGTVVSADYVIGVISGADRTRVSPQMLKTNHLSDSVPPISYWGRTYVLVKTDTVKTDMVKIIASRDNTVVTIRSCDVTTINIEHAYQDYYTFALECDVSQISSTSDILVGHFVERWANNAGLYYPLPVKYYSDNYVISALPNNGVDTCKLVVITASIDAHTLTINGDFVGVSWTTVSSPNYMYTIITLPVTHTYIKLTETGGKAVGGHLICTSSDSTRVTALMPASYDESIQSSVYQRGEDTAAIDECKLVPETTTVVVTDGPTVKTTDDITVETMSTIVITTDDVTTILTTTDDTSTTLTTTDDVSTSLITTDDGSTTLTTTGDVSTTLITADDESTTLITTDDGSASLTTTDDVSTTRTTYRDIPTTITTTDDVSTTLTTTNDVSTKSTTIGDVSTHVLSTTTNGSYVMCMCIGCHNRSLNLTTAEILLVLTELKTNLRVKKNKTSAWIRRHSCAEDNRYSARALGFGGIMILFSSVLAIILADVSTLYSSCR